MNAKQDFADELRNSVIEVEIHLRRISRTKTLTQRHKDQIADKLKTKRKKVSGHKQLFPDNEPHIKAIFSALWEPMRILARYTLKYEKGSRLLKKKMFQDFQDEVNEAIEELNKACAVADENYDKILDACEKDLNQNVAEGEQGLFDRNDYPETFTGSFGVSWEVKNFEPSEELLELAPETYAREQQRVAQRMETALAVYEDETRAKLQELIDNLVNRLNPEDGKKVVYTEAVTTNMREFFDRFKTLGIVSDASLNGLVDDAEKALGNTTMSQLKGSAAKRKKVNADFGKLKSTLDTLVKSAPTRSININDLED